MDIEKIFSVYDMVDPAIEEIVVDWKEVPPHVDNAYTIANILEDYWAKSLEDYWAKRIEYR